MIKYLMFQSNFYERQKINKKFIIDCDSFCLRILLSISNLFFLAELSKNQ